MTVRNIARIVGRIAAAVLIVAIFVYAYFLNTYIYFPRSPSPEAGRTVPFEVKGIIVYTTQQQSDQFHWLLLGDDQLRRNFPSCGSHTWPGSVQTEKLAGMVSTLTQANNYSDLLSVIARQPFRHQHLRFARPRADADERQRRHLAVLLRVHPLLRNAKAPPSQRVWADDFPAVALPEFVAFVVAERTGGALQEQLLDVAAGGGRCVEK
jgi:hypothetical protein